MSDLSQNFDRLGDALQSQITHSTRFAIISRKMIATLDGMSDLYADAAAQGLIPLSVATSMIEYSKTMMDLFQEFQENATETAKDSQAIGAAIRDLLGPIDPGKSE